MALPPEGAVDPLNTLLSEREVVGEVETADLVATFTVVYAAPYLPEPLEAIPQL